MTQSKAQLYNITLNILGVSTPLENVNSNNNRAILLNNYYDLARDYVLKDYDWNFACTYRRLALCDDQSNNFKYKYCYDYPNDCVCARDIFDTNYTSLQKFFIASNASGKRVILCDCSEAILRYTRRVEKEVYFSCEFSIALAYYLASLTANVITGSIQKGELAYEKYRTIIKRAKIINAQEGAENIYNDDTYLDSRN